jgi:hypothetical protein
LVIAELPPMKIGPANFGLRVLSIAQCEVRVGELLAHTGVMPNGCIAAFPANEIVRALIS